MEVERQPRPWRNRSSNTKYDVCVKGIENPSHYTSQGRGKGENWPRQYVARSCPMARGDRANLLVTKAVEGRKVHGWRPLCFDSVVGYFGEWEMLKRGV